MKPFDTKVQLLKYRVLKEVAKLAMHDSLSSGILDIHKAIIPTNKATMRCCVYKERAIVNERVKLATNSSIEEFDSWIQVIKIACDECPVGGYEVTSGCRGCIAHRCEQACKRNAITFDNHQKAHIDKSKCIECGLCAKVCPYNAIHNFKRPCELACKVNAITMDVDKAANIDHSKCITCGACVYQCPFGAIMDKSELVPTIQLIKKSRYNTQYKVYAVVAPAIASQYEREELGQILKAIKNLGFYNLVEAALGADLATVLETEELLTKPVLTSSCCPSFVEYIKKHHPKAEKHISHTPSPMALVGKIIKTSDPTAKVVFIGPCIAKKQEAKLSHVKPYVDAVITFEELQAWIDAADINLGSLVPERLDNASYFGRIFAKSGGLSKAVLQCLKEEEKDVSLVNPIIASGIDQCKVALLKLSVNKLGGNFLEGMACSGGCIGGPCNLTHEEKDEKEIEWYGQSAYEQNIHSSIRLFRDDTR